MNLQTAKIGIIGGTGKLGFALAARLARAGCTVIVGSRDSAKAKEAVATLDSALSVTAADNIDAAAQADLVIVTVPFSAQAQTLQDIAAVVAGKIVVDTTVPLVPPKVARVQLPPEGSAAQCAQNILGENVRVVSAFHNVSAHKMALDTPLECDVLVFSDDVEARGLVVELSTLAGMRGLHAGSLANSAAAEAMTSILIFMNRHYKSDGAGIRITAV